jgi:hypothetical protein
MMSRSKYIYHIRSLTGMLVASFTVKYEASEWMKRSCCNFNDYNLFSMRDGVCEIMQKYEKKRGLELRNVTLPKRRDYCNKRCITQTYGSVTCGI